MRFFERVIVGAFITGSILFSLAPDVYIAGHSHSDATYVAWFFNPLDNLQYLSDMRQGMAGSWLARDEYTSEPQKGVFLHTLYLFLGHLARTVGSAPETIFFASKALFGLLLMGASIYCIRTFVHEERVRLCIYPFLFFGSGLGFINPYSIDTWIADANPLIRFFSFPHFILANALLLLSISWLFRFASDRAVWRLWLATVATGILNLVIPYHAVVVYAITLFFFFEAWFIQHSKYLIRSYLLFFACSLPTFVMILLTSFQQEPLVLEEKFPFSSLNPAYIFSGFALAWVLFATGLRRMLETRSREGFVVATWLALVLLFVYFLPVDQKRRTMETAAYVPLYIGAGFGAMRLYSFLRQWIKEKQTFFRVSVSATTVSAIAFLFFLGCQNSWEGFLSRNQRIDSPMSPYASNASIAAMRWLGSNTPDDSVTLSSFTDGRSIPAIANRTVYVGHFPGTLNLNEKMKKVEAFYSGKESEDVMKRFLKKERITHVFVSSLEKKSPEFDPATYDFLSRVYQKDGVEIYQVR